MSSSDVDSPSPSSYFSSMIIDGLGYEVLFVFAFIFTLLVIFVSSFRSSGANVEGPGQRFQLQPRQAGLAVGPCPICLDDSPQLAVQTSCGHYFCGHCFLTLWNDRVLNSVACPLCRQAVTILFPAFSAEELAQQHAADIGGDAAAATEGRDRVEQLLARVNRFNRYNSGRGVPLWDLLRDLPTLVPHLIADLFSPTGFSFIYLARVALIGLICLAYLVSPLDILPEAVFGVLGLLDDLVVLLLCLIFVVFMYRDIISRREFHT